MAEMAITKTLKIFLKAACRSCQSHKSKKFACAKPRRSSAPKIPH